MKAAHLEQDIVQKAAVCHRETRDQEENDGNHSGGEVQGQKGGHQEENIQGQEVDHQEADPSQTESHHEKGQESHSSSGAEGHQEAAQGQIKRCQVQIKNLS